VFNDADMDAAVQGLVRGAFTFSGQACISVQRIYVQSEAYEDFLRRFIPHVQSLVVGDPRLESTNIGPMINEGEAKRAEQWIEEAKQQGAVVLTGGKRQGTILQPTVLVNVSPHMKVVCEEVFAPIVSVIPFETDEEAVKLANDSNFGLQAGVFTKELTEH
jgi:acyl-CoA reductase-like NAD-dependent aldehyde dehydrogenase